MNHAKSSKQSNNCRFQSNNSQDDFQKLMNICSSYGLNEQQTNQLIDQFKKGALFSADQSFSDSLNQSQLEQVETEKHHEEEYSFKHHKQSLQDHHSYRKDEPSMHQPEQMIPSSKQTHRPSSDQPNFSFQLLEKMLTQKFSIEKSLVKNLQQQNNRLRNEVQQKDRQLNKLAQMKSQDTEIILGLKDIISNLTIALKQKDASYKDIQERYNNLMQNRLKELSSKRSLTEFSECQLQDATNNYQNSMRDSSCNKRSTKNLKQNREQQKEKYQEYAFDKKRGNRIDVKKYKEMIQNLRNNCN